MEVYLWFLAAVCVAVGVAGIVIPVLPDAPLVWLGMVFAAWADGFTRVSGWTLGFLAILAASTIAIDFVAAAAGAKRVKASRWAIVGATVGTILGMFFGLPGLVLGPLVGAVAGELVHHRDWKAAGRVGVGTSIGLLLGMAAKTALVFAMLGLFALAYLI